jgi:hypothetical protein
VIKLFDTNSVSKSGDLPINYRGDLVDKSNRYPDLLENHFNNTCFINQTVINNPIQLSYSLYIGTANFSTKVIMTGLP